MKVVFVGSYNENEKLSGPEKVCKRIFSEYAAIDETLFIDYYQDGKKYSFTKKIFGIDYFAKVNKSNVLKLGVLRMIIVLLRYKPKYIHILSFNRYAIFVFLLKLFYQVRVYYNINGIIAHEVRLNNDFSLPLRMKNIIVENILIYFSDKLFILSDYTKVVLQNYYSIKGIDFAKVINGLDNCFVDSVISKKKIQNSIVFVGDINSPLKGFAYLWEVLCNLKINVNLFVVSNNKYGIIVRKHKNICTYFVDKMNSDNLVEFYKDKLIVVSPSMFDTFNLSVLEAAACGLIPVLTVETGASSVLIKTKEAKIVSYGKPDELKIVLENLFKQQRYNNNFDYNSITWKKVLAKYYLSHYV